MTVRKNNKRDQKSLIGRFLLILGITFFALYFFMGVAIIFWDDFPIQMEFKWKVAFGVLLIVYAFFRFIRLLKRPDQDNN